MGLPNVNLDVGGSLYFRAGSTTGIDSFFSGHPNITVTKDIEFHSPVDLSEFYLLCVGDGTTWIRVCANVTLGKLTINKEGIAAISNLSTHSLTINGDLNVRNYSTFHHAFSGTTIVKGDMTASVLVTCQLIDGTISFEGDTNASLSMHGTNKYLQNIRIKKDSDYSLTLSTNVEVKGNLTITSGKLDAGDMTITLGGNWINTAGEASFLEGTSTVIFDGSGGSYIYNGNFNNLVMNKSGSGHITRPNGYTVSAATYEWLTGALNVTGGIFTAYDMIDDAMLGTITISAGEVHFHQDLYQSLDLRGSLNLSGTGELHIYGEQNDVWMPYGGNATLNMSGNSLLYTNDAGIYIYHGNTLTSNISGGTIRIAGDFKCSRSDFNPTGGTVEFVGSINAALNMPAGSLYNVTINKGARDEDADAPDFITERDGSRTRLTRLNSVQLNSNLDVNGSVMLAKGTFNAGSRTINVTRHWTTASTAVFDPGTSTVIFGGSGESRIDNGNFNNLVLNKPVSGRIIIQSGSTVSAATYKWMAGPLNVTGGSFTAYDMIDDAMQGTITISGGKVHFHQDTSQWLDLRGFLSITGTGELHIYGVQGDVFMPWGGGLLYVHDTGIYIHSSNTLTSNISGGTICTAGGFRCFRNDFNPTGGTVKFVGSTDAELFMEAGSLYTIKRPGTRMQTPPILLPSGTTPKPG